MIEDWFTNNGYTFDVEEYDRWDRAYDDWVRESSGREMNHQLGECLPTYSSKTTESRLFFS
jgi:hypothetical protein